MRSRRRPVRAPDRSTRYRRSWREVLAVYRRPLAAVLAALAVAASLSALAPEHTETVPVLVAARDLPSGTVLDSGSLHLAQVADRALPPDVLDSVGDAAGQQLAIPVAAGSPVAATMLVGPGLLTGSPPGTVAVPVRPSDTETIGLLSPGQLVDVVLSQGNGYERAVDSKVIAERVPVLWVPTGSAGSWLDGGDAAGMVVVAASRQDSAELAGAAARGKIFLVLVGPG
ncbi:Flp pilus assembly protein CpaB [Arthrobacter rhombi]|uniref:Flp pilus assembly protein CpaB n=1 Tax=Arthrobacter rhombi TaxID=71253 RepID=UPI0031D5334A